MTYQRIFLWVTIGCPLVVLSGIDCHAQDAPQGHSCTVDVAGTFAAPFGRDGKDFDTGGGFQAGGGFAVTPSVEPRHGVVLYLTANFMYDRLKATPGALAVANKQLATANSAHGGFSAATLDLMARYPMSGRASLYVSGGFGWFRRDVNFDGANPGTLLEASGSTIEKLAENSGVLDLGGGINFGLKHKGGLMLFAEVRVYKGLAVNGGTTLLPISAGVRW